ncbi:MAG: DinB family protein [Kineosporiaceae bacterium]
MTEPIVSKVTRREPPETGAERELLESFLDYHRDTLLLKCEGLDAAGLKARATPPSALSLLGLVRHLTDVERYWFRMGVDGQRPGFLYWGESEDEPDTDFEVEDADPAADVAAYRAEVAAAREVAARHGLDETFTIGRRGPLSVRWVYVHMIEEYARHNGHADLLREAVDGTVGD